MNHKNPGPNWVWRIVYPILAYMGIYYLISLLASVIGMTVSVVQLEQAGGGSLDYYTILQLTTEWLSQYSYEVTTVSNLVTLPVVFLFLRSNRKRGGEQYRQYDRVSIGYYLPVLALGVCACLAVNGMMYISGIMTTYSETLEEVSSQLYRGQLLVELLGIGILSPIVEEILFRGLCMKRLQNGVGSTASIFLAAAFFALYHGNILQMIYAFILGLIFGYVYEKYHSLAAPILAHCGANIVSVLGSETDLIDGFFASDTTIFAGTILCCLVMLGCFYLVQYQVNPAPLHREEESSSQDSGR
ncbi:MAG: CPBP family intramembrane metalloprotease [Lachnospiraceae bacterium]|nr:CPBP family intramembrane metalloprotease [Lachnospiraceae bacterium]